MPTSDFFRSGAAPMASPFSDYLQPKTLSQQRAAQPSWLNVGFGANPGPFGQNGGDISGAGWQNPIDLFTRQAEESMAKLANQGMTGGVPAQSGPMGSPGGKWANIDRWDSAVAAAAAKYGVDPNRLKAHMMIESGGNPDAVQNNPTNGNTYGMMQINPAIWNDQLQAQGINMYTPEGNIMGAAYILSTLNQQYGSWDAASSAYFTGNPSWNGVVTVNGTTGGDYRSMLNGYITELASYGGSGGGGLRQHLTGSGPGGGNWTSIFGGAGTPISYEFDAPSVNGNMYNYAASYGLSGMSHPGLDVSVPRGTPLFSPGSGVVSCVGSADAGVGGTGGGSCGYFGDSDGGGIGNITIKLDNGTFVILGHSATASVRPGQRVTAGTAVGTSGGMYGAHTHLEVRVPDASMPGGYRVVDPRSVLGGGAMGPSYQQTSGNYSAAYGGGNLMAGYSSIWDANAPWRSYKR
jgi:murein DD-endopeptidase MepM/ murein hydrolase activator NlpD